MMLDYRDPKRKKINEANATLVDLEIFAMYSQADETDDEKAKEKAEEKAEEKAAPKKRPSKQRPKITHVMGRRGRLEGDGGDV